MSISNNLSSLITSYSPIIPNTNTKFPIIQAGRSQITEDGGVSSTGNGTVTFPNSFPSGATVYVTMTPHVGDNTSMYTVSVYDLTITGFRYCVMYKDGKNGQTGGGGARVNTVEPTYYYNYVAVGYF
jgi:hypothetical protein